MHIQNTRTHERMVRPTDFLSLSFFTHTHTHAYTHGQNDVQRKVTVQSPICVCMCLCLCLCVCVRNVSCEYACEPRSETGKDQNTVNKCGCMCAYASIRVCAGETEGCYVDVYVYSPPYMFLENVDGSTFSFLSFFLSLSLYFSKGVTFLI